MLVAIQCSHKTVSTPNFLKTWVSLHLFTLISPTSKMKEKNLILLNMNETNYIFTTPRIVLLLIKFTNNNRQNWLSRVYLLYIISLLESYLYIKKWRKLES